VKGNAPRKRPIHTYIRYLDSIALDSGGDHRRVGEARNEIHSRSRSIRCNERYSRLESTFVAIDHSNGRIPLLDFFDLRPSFDTYYGREKTVESLSLKKPNPHYLERALSDLEAETALYVGDSESDVAAAHRAGVDSAFVRRPHCREVELTASPTHDVDDLHGVATIVDIEPTK
jgi:hypothetical protein